MSRIALRPLVVGGARFLWYRRHRHAPGEGCAEIVRVFLAGRRRAFLEIVFRERAGWGVGYPQAGVVWATRSAASHNLNRPAVISALVHHMIRAGWNPDVQDAPLIVSDGIPLLASSGAPSEPAR